MYTILTVLILAIFLYTIIPYLLSFGLNWRVYRHNHKSKKIAFTFDDGPDPFYTPLLLDLLNKFNIKATFFVVGSRAELYPEIILRMHQEGHLIGIHNYVHSSNWFTLPWKIRRDLDYSAAVINGITGTKPIYYRPPWGLMNLFDFFLLKSYRIILWSVMVGDWKENPGVEKIKARLLKKIKHGDIILLHDCGDTPGADFDAPMNTINALKEVLSEMQAKGIQSVRVDELWGKPILSNQRITF
ncbi:polysaccharide deacetylase family protein [Neobacillus niacini]|uniref:polysaccharide deacetylase family protein n=1 Tax=Neobacillus niacini TaxID=86668 RepID=UPI002856CDE8|nr:polysaccharide deacetylase family protein [Neobacillus niacini]MDR7001866.1 peptidoglycan/xylan/chitin deacetylase (PgdA/CDA1 family) [Neobacillus niacini]